VFVDTHGRFLTMAPPTEIRERPAQRWPALEKAYAAFRDQVAKIADLAEHLWQYAMAVAQSLEKQEETAKEDVTAQGLERKLGITRDAEIVFVGDKGQVFLQREILGRATPFAALIRDERLEGLVERQELALRVAGKVLSLM
jgi:hypothetical protein